MKKLLIFVFIFIAIVTIALSILVYKGDEANKSAEKLIKSQSINTNFDESGLLDLRPYILNQLAGEQAKKEDYDKGLINNSLPLTNNERLICNSLTEEDKKGLLNTFGFSEIENLVTQGMFYYKAKYESDEQNCRIYLSRINNASTTKNDNKTMSVYALSQVYFDKPFFELNQCELSGIFAIAKLDDALLKQNSSATEACNTDDIIANEDLSRHPFVQAEKYAKFSTFKDKPLSALIDHLNELDIKLEAEVANLKKRYNRTLTFDVSVTNIKDGSVYRYIEGDAERDWPMASVAKLFIARAVVEKNEPTATVDKLMQQMLCKSNTKAAQELFWYSRDIASKFVDEYNITTYGNIPRVIFTTENQGIPTRELRRFLYDFATILVDKEMYLDNALGKGCTASVINLPENYKVIFAKTGTAYANPQVLAKLLTISFENELGDPYVMLLRIHGDWGLPVCRGHGCFNNKNLQNLVTIMAKSNI